MGTFIPDEGLRLTNGWKKYRVRKRSNLNMSGEVPKIIKGWRTAQGTRRTVKK